MLYTSKHVFKLDRGNPVIYTDGFLLELFNIPIAGDPNKFVSGNQRILNGLIGKTLSLTALPPIPKENGHKLELQYAKITDVKVSYFQHHVIFTQSYLRVEITLNLYYLADGKGKDTGENNGTPGKI